MNNKNKKHCKDIHFSLSQFSMFLAYMDELPQKERNELDDMIYDLQQRIIFMAKIKTFKRLDIPYNL